MKEKSNLIRFFVTFYMPIMYAILVLDTLILGILVIFVSIFDEWGKRVHYLGKLWSRMNLFFSGVRVRVHGLEKIDRKKSYIVMPNHQSLYDVWALIGYIPLQLRWVMKKELRKVPLFGFACARMGHIYVDRGDYQRAKKSLEVSHNLLKNNLSVVFFPEGTRSPDGKLLPFKKGGFVIAIETKIPILPITINGSRYILPKGSMRCIPGTIHITIHDPVSVEGFTYENKEKLMDIVKNKIEQSLEFSQI